MLGDFASWHNQQPQWHVPSLPSLRWLRSCLVGTTPPLDHLTLRRGQLWEIRSQHLLRTGIRCHDIVEILGWDSVARTLYIQVWRRHSKGRDLSRTARRCQIRLGSGSSHWLPYTDLFTDTSPPRRVAVSSSAGTARSFTTSFPQPAPTFPDTHMATPPWIAAVHAFLATTGISR